MFNFDESKIPDLKMTKSVYNSFDEHYVIYEANGWTFESPGEESLAAAEKAIYAWIAWYQRLEKLSDLKD